MEQGLTKKQLTNMRKHYIHIAMIDRGLIRENKKVGILTTVLRATKKENLRIASDLKRFWPVICGVV